MSRIITLFFTLIAIAFAAVVNPQPARADLPPAAWHCASQENCLGVLRDSDVLLTRNGMEKGTITEMGTGLGMMTISNGWIIVTRPPQTYVYLHEIATGYTCSIFLQEQCYQAVKWGDYVFITCPAEEFVQRISLDCQSYQTFLSNGRDGKYMVEGPDRLYIIFGQELYYSAFGPNNETPSGQNWAHFIDAGGKMGVYLNDPANPDRLLFNRGETIYSVITEPRSNQNASVFYTLPAGIGEGFMVGNNEKVLVSSNFGDTSYLIDVATQTDIVLDVPSSNSVALSKDTAYIGGADTSGIVAAYDFNGIERSFSPISTQNYYIAYSAPTLPPVCNNGLVEPNELCDGSDFDGDLCQNYEWQNGINFTGGELSCSADCLTSFTSGCYACGDGVKNTDELCDSTDLGGSTCQDHGFASGNLACATDCTFDTSGCYTCGNGQVEGAEQCEGLDLQGNTCESIGFVSGTLACGSDCMFDTSSCSACGNGIADPGETCDGTSTPGLICQTFPGGSFTGGQLACNASCSDYDTSGCYLCGDGNVDPTEECDATNLSGQTCESLGYSGGSLACFDNCTLNITGCEGAPTEICGNNTIDALEECDDGGRENGDGCDENCRLESITCGNGVIDDPLEVCDGTDMNNASCESLGYDYGVLFCGANCRLNETDCKYAAGPQNIIITPNAPPQPGDLSGQELAEYQSNLQTMEPGCDTQTMGDSVVISVLPGSYYCNVTGFNPVTKERLFHHLYNPENALENAPPVVRYYASGEIRENMGGQIKASRGLNSRTIIGLPESAWMIEVVSQAYASSEGRKFLSAHPKTATAGKWLVVNIDGGSQKFCPNGGNEGCLLMIAGPNGKAIINLDLLEDLGGYLIVPTKEGGCSCSSGGNDFSFVFPFLVLISLVLSARRRKTKAR